MSFKSGFESRERESQFNTSGGSEYQVRGVAVLNARLANDVRRNGTHSSGTDDDHKHSTKHNRMSDVFKEIHKSQCCCTVF